MRERRERERGRGGGGDIWWRENARNRREREKYDGEKMRARVMREKMEYYLFVLLIR